ncbi:MAG TPA: hypothetical protein VK249_05735 [Anaerolineales bacterium]|nr:hypothetical protein [Anaerolineales bacterium]
MDEKIKGGVSLWDRIINDLNFIKAKRQIQLKYGLPLPYDIRLNHEGWMKWMGSDEKPTSQIAKRRKAFLADVQALFKKFEVPEAWHSDFIAEIAGQPDSHSLEASSSPKFEFYKDSDGNIKWQCIITPETDLTNPMILDLIQSQQKAWAGDPPRPAKDKNNPRKLDWRPVYDWYKRHPLFTLEEIAKKLGYPAHKVKIKFSEFEKRNLIR